LGAQSLNLRLLLQNDTITYSRSNKGSQVGHDVVLNDYYKGDNKKPKMSAVIPSSIRSRAKVPAELGVSPWRAENSNFVSRHFLRACQAPPKPTKVKGESIYFIVAYNLCA
jgi:hypothetical protein